MSLTVLSTASLVRIYGCLRLDMPTIVNLRRTANRMNKIARDNDFDRTDVHLMQLKHYTDAYGFRTKFEVAITRERATVEEWKRVREQREESDLGKFDKIFIITGYKHFEEKVDQYELESKLLEEVFKSVKSMFKLSIKFSLTFGLDAELLSLFHQYPNEIRNLRKLSSKDSDVVLDSASLLSINSYTKLSNLKLRGEIHHPLLTNENCKNFDVIDIANIEPDRDIHCTDLTDDIFGSWLLNPPTVLCFTNIRTNFTIEGLFNFVKMSLLNLSEESIRKVYGSLNLDMSTIVNLRKTCYRMDNIAVRNDFHKAHVHLMDLKYVTDDDDLPHIFEVSVSRRLTVDDWKKKMAKFYGLTIWEQKAIGNLDRKFAIKIPYSDVDNETEKKLMAEVFESVKTVRKLLIEFPDDWTLTDDFLEMIYSYFSLEKLYIKGGLFYLDGAEFYNLLSCTGLKSLRLSANIHFDSVLDDENLENLTTICISHMNEGEILECPGVTDAVLEKWLLNPPKVLSLDNIMTNITIKGMHNFVKRVVDHPRASELNYGFDHIRLTEQNMLDLVQFQKSRRFKWIPPSWGNYYQIRHTRTSMKFTFKMTERAD